MGNFFWIIMGLIGLTLITLFASGDSSKIMGLQSDQFAYLAIMSLWAFVIGASVFNSRQNFSHTIKQVIVWIGIFLVLIILYVFRFDFQDFASRLTGGLIAGSPISTTDQDGRSEVTLIRAGNGHFEANTKVNGNNVRFLVDTGATSIVLSATDAENVGIDLSRLSFSVPSQTANGIAYSAISKIESLKIGAIERTNLQVMVSKPGSLFQSLLGQQFLESLSSYEKRGDRLTLRD